MTLAEATGTTSENGSTNSTIKSHGGKSDAKEKITISDVLEKMEEKSTVVELENLLMLRVEDLCDLFSVSKRKAHEFIDLPSFPSIQPGGPKSNIYIPLGLLKRWVNLKVREMSMQNYSQNPELEELMEKEFEL